MIPKTQNVEVLLCDGFSLIVLQILLVIEAQSHFPKSKPHEKDQGRL